MKEKPRILIVDDSANMRETLTDILEEKGYSTQTARTAREAIQKAQESVFNIALIDINLPDKTGIEVLRTFRRNHPSRMNIVITGNATLATAVDALNLGANAYIMKPIDLEKLDQIIKDCLKKQREGLKIIEERLAEFMEAHVEGEQKESKENTCSTEI
jgi:DNA-binding NtrC family response regulator